MLLCPAMMRQAVLHRRHQAHMIENRFLYAALLAEAEQSPRIRFAVGQPVETFRFGPGLASVTLAGGAEHRAGLIAAADGRNSPAREAAGIKLIGWPYDQMGLVATVAHGLPHHGRAEEHFTPSGPFAILPLPGNQSSLVWSERREEGQRLLQWLCWRPGRSLSCWCRCQQRGPHFQSRPLSLYQPGQCWTLLRFSRWRRLCSLHCPPQRH